MFIWKGSLFVQNNNEVLDIFPINSICKACPVSQKLSHQSRELLLFFVLCYKTLSYVMNRVCSLRISLYCGKVQAWFMNLLSEPSAEFIIWIWWEFRLVLCRRACLNVWGLWTTTNSRQFYSAYFRSDKVWLFIFSRKGEKQTSLPPPWRHVGAAEVKLHSFWTSTLNGKEW
jgi:hypothetical protein